MSTNENNENVTTELKVAPVVAHTSEGFELFNLVDMFDTRFIPDEIKDDVEHLKNVIAENEFTFVISEDAYAYLFYCAITGSPSLDNIANYSDFHYESGRTYRIFEDGTMAEVSL